MFTENMGGVNQDNDSPTEPPVPSNVARVPEIDMVESKKQEIQIDVGKTTQFLPKLEMSKRRKKRRERNVNERERVRSQTFLGFRDRFKR